MDYHLVKSRNITTGKEEFFDIVKMQDKLKRRGVQIADLKHKVKELKEYKKDYERLCQYLVNKGLFQEAREFKGY